MISVIIPIYNLEDYLSRCFNSLIAQDNHDFEVLMVNDGSLDHSEEICRKYELKDDRFRLYNKDNGGVSSARNLGLQHANGEWVVFVDGDDIVDSKYLTMPDNLNEIDVIEKSYYIKSQDSILLSNVINEDSTLYTNQNVLKYYAEYIQSNSATLCNKIIRKNIIDNQRFDETKVMGEDFLFFLSIISKINVYCRMSQGSYCYIRRETSASKTIDADQINRAKKLFSNLNSIKVITKASGIEALGVNIIHTIYMPYLLKLKEYLKFKDWFKIFKIWCTFPFSPKDLMSSYQRKLAFTQLPKSIIKSILRK